MANETKISQLSGALGAEISGIDVARIGDTDFASIYDAFLEFGVIALRDQNLSPEAFVATAKRFGSLAEYPFAEGLDGHPEITVIIKEPHQTSNFGGMWHTDTTYQPEPPKATLLYAVETPAVGGDTLFADMRLAYEQLSPGMRELLGDLHAINSSTLHAASLRANHLKSGSMTGKEAAPRALEAKHPVVRTHPETQRKGLYVNPAHTSMFIGMTREESAPILDYLFRQQTRPELTCRLNWQPGTLAIWDNRSTQHCAINDYDDHRREMWRITIKGDRPR